MWLKIIENLTDKLVKTKQERKEKKKKNRQQLNNLSYDVFSYLLCN